MAQIDRLQGAQRRELVEAQLGDGVVGQAKDLERVVAVERLGVHRGQVVVRQVQLDHDLQVPEKV